MLDKYRTGVGLDECAAAARSRGFPVFALQGYGMCFFGSMADVALQQASQKLPDASCNNLPCSPSAASCSSYINKIYFLIGAGKSFNSTMSLMEGARPYPGLVREIYPGSAVQAFLACTCGIEMPMVDTNTLHLGCLFVMEVTLVVKMVESALLNRSALRPGCGALRGS